MAPRCRPHDPAFSALFMAIIIRRYLFPVFHENERAHYDRVQVAVPDISKYYYTEQRLCFLRGDHVSVDKRRSQPSAEKVPVQNAGKQRWRLETQKTNSYTAVPGSRLPGTSGYVFQEIFAAKAIVRLESSGWPVIELHETPLRHSKSLPKSFQTIEIFPEFCP